MDTLAAGTAMHVAACWGGAGSKACDNAKVNAFLLPVGWAGGKAGESLAERSSPGVRPFIIGACDFVISRGADLWKTFTTGG